MHQTRLLEIPRALGKKTFLGPRGNHRTQTERGLATSPKTPGNPWKTPEGDSRTRSLPGPRGPFLAPKEHSRPKNLPPPPLKPGVPNKPLREFPSGNQGLTKWEERGRKLLKRGNCEFQWANTQEEKVARWRAHLLGNLDGVLPCFLVPAPRPIWLKVSK